MSSFFQLFSLTLPLYVLVLVGFGLSRWGSWPKPASEALSRFVFSVALPPFLFHMMSDFSKLPPVDARLLIAFFGGCLIVFVIGRLIARFLFKLDGVAQSVFALGGVFSNNVLLGLPLAKSILGTAAIPAVVLVLAAPLSLIVVGMGLAEYGIREGWQQSVAISAIKLAVQPFVVWILAQMLGLPPLETRVVVLLASLAVGVNVYLMSRHFQSMEAPVATSMVLTTALSTVTTPLALSLVGV
ncbi:MAG: AEC family transporter [Proteobacteria bacterium]|nr:AEC family transporter [Pseudomonadota bacterium]